jgi:hypothetical protein
MNDDGYVFFKRIKGSELLKMILLNEIPCSRMCWYLKIVGLNEAVSYKGI